MKNYPHVVTVDKNKHAKTKIKQNLDFTHAKEINLASVSLGELSACTSNYPVVFVRHPQNLQQFRLVAMFGLRAGENSFYAADGWDCTYIPLIVQRYPFLIGFDDREEDSTTLTICLDTSSELINEAEGISLFNESGGETEYLQTRKMLLSDIFEGEKITDQFSRKMAELNLLAPIELIVQPQGEDVSKITGMYTLDESKLKALSPEQLQELQKLDFLPACYLVRGSLFQVHNLMNKRGLKTGQVLNYRIELNPVSTEGLGPGVPVV